MVGNNPKEQSVIKKLSELKPYKSLLLARVQSSIAVKDIVDNLLEDLRDLLSLGEDGPRTVLAIPTVSVRITIAVNLDALLKHELRNEYL